MPESDIAQVYSAADTQEASFIKFLLAESGIEANVVGDVLRNVAGEVPLGWATSPQVWVATDDEMRARAVISAWESGRQESEERADAEKWQCPQCGESVPGTFDVCWQCQTPHSD